MEESKYKFFNDVRGGEKKKKKKTLQERIEERAQRERQNQKGELSKDNDSFFNFEDGGVPCDKKKKKQRLAALAKLAKSGK